MTECGTFHGVTDQDGYLPIPHGGGRTPHYWSVTGMDRLLAYSADGTRLVLRSEPRRSVHGAWWAKF